MIDFGEQEVCKVCGSPFNAIKFVTFTGDYLDFLLEARKDLLEEAIEEGDEEEKAFAKKEMPMLNSMIKWTALHKSEAFEHNKWKQANK